MSRPDFKKATDLLCLSGRDLSRLFGVPVQSIKQARLDPSNPGHRPAPDGWEAVLAKLARQRGGELAKLADALEQGAR